MQKPALLVTEDGSVFHGHSVGVDGLAVGEVVFNTALTGYQEILTDPSYAKQLITLTHTHIGNVGVNDTDNESNRVWAKGLIINELSPVASNWRSEKTLGDWLVENKVVAISGIDTRQLTRLIREHGALKGTIVTNFGASDSIETVKAQAMTALHDFPGLVGMDLASVVTTDATYPFNEHSWFHQEAKNSVESLEDKPHVVAVDFGVKRSILRLLVDFGARVTVVPAKTSAEEILALSPDGVFLSNGPGDPAACEYAIEMIKALLQEKLPLFGICLGHQLLALALGAKTVKMKCGHHGGNHPVRDEQQGNVLITSQNHGFTVDEPSLPESLKVTHRSLFDKTIQGIAHVDRPIFGFQGHPEAGPGPQDALALFKNFISAVNTQSPVTM